MTKKKTGKKKEHGEQWVAMGCCLPQEFAEMMAKSGEGMQYECAAMMKRMTKGGCCQTEQK